MRNAHRSSAFAPLTGRNTHPDLRVNELRSQLTRWRTIMINFTKVTAALVLGVALAGATPALAAQRIHHSGLNARAQAVQSEQALPGVEGVSGSRAKAIQDCMGTSGKFSQSTWGNTQVQLYRSCMAGHGEVE
jgi:hypothetical protein